MAKAVLKKGSTTKAANKNKAAAKTSPPPAPKTIAKAGGSPKAAAKPVASVPASKKTPTLAIKESKPASKAQATAPKAAAVSAKIILPTREIPKNGTSAHTPLSNGQLKLKKKERKEKKPINNPPVPPAPVLSSDARAKKNQAGFSSKELETFRDLLLAKRRELMGDMSSMEREALRTSGSNLSNLPIHMADMGTDNYEQEFTLGIVEKDRGLIREINQALAKIQNGSYGICEGTGKPISKARLEVQPWAKYSIEHARELEKRRGRF